MYIALLASDLIQALESFVGLYVTFIDQLHTAVFCLVYTYIYESCSLQNVMTQCMWLSSFFCLQ